MDLRVTKFLRYHKEQKTPVDARVERKLRSQPPWIQHAVIERGECTSRVGATSSLGPESLALPRSHAIWARQVEQAAWSHAI